MNILTRMTKLMGAASAVLPVPPNAQPSPRGCRRFTLVNFGAGSIGCVYARPAGSGEWGRDLLAGRSLPPGAFEDLVPAVDTGGRRFDLWVAYRCGAVQIIRGVELFSGKDVCVTELGARTI